MQEKKDLTIPHDILSDKNLNPHQRLIVSALSEEPRMFYGEIAKRICTERKDVKKELGELVNLKIVHVSNGDQRPEYSIKRGLGFVGSEIHTVDPLKEREKKEKERSKEKEKREKEITLFKKKRNSALIPSGHKATDRAESKLFLDVEDKITLAFNYWVNNGGIKHKYGSKEYNNSIRSLRKIFEGIMFINIPDSNINSPLLNKTRTFQLEDWYTSIDNFNLAVVDFAYEPKSKNSITAYRKKVKLWQYIYNPFSQSSKKSSFLFFLESLKLASTVESIYPKLQEVLEITYRESGLQIPDNPDFLKVASNNLGNIIKQSRQDEEYLWTLYKESKTQVCELFMDYLTNEIKDFHFKMLTSKWLYDTRLRNWLSKKGVIN